VWGIKVQLDYFFNLGVRGKGSVKVTHGLCYPRERERRYPLYRRQNVN